MSNKFTVNEMGTVNCSEYSYKMYKITYNQSSENEKRYLIISGIHGNEEASVYALKDFIFRFTGKYTQKYNYRFYLYIKSVWI